MRKLIVFFLVLFVNNGYSQDLTGTWSAKYYRDLPGNKREFYYRINLIQSGDSVFGILDVLDGQTDVKGLSPDNAEVIGRYQVFNANLSERINAEEFILVVGNVLEIKQGGTSLVNSPPRFGKIKCSIFQPKNGSWDSKPTINYSLMPVLDKSIGELTVNQVSKEVPDLSPYYSPINLKNQLKRIRKKPAHVTDTLAGKSGVDLAEAPKKVKDKPVIVSNTNKEAMRTDPAVSPNVSVTALKKRKEVVQKELETSVNDAIIDIYDNGVVDNDSISLFMNDELLLSHKRLSEKAIHVVVKLNTNAVNKFTLFADNLGDIPPNTALMTITLGDKRYDVFLSSSFENNATVLISVKKLISAD